MNLTLNQRYGEPPVDPNEVAELRGKNFSHSSSAQKVLASRLRMPFGVLRARGASRFSVLVCQLISIAIEFMSDSPDNFVRTVVRSSKTQLNPLRGGIAIEVSPIRGHNNPRKGENVNIQNVVRSISKKEIKNVQKKAKQHFEGGSTISQMNMIAFD